MESTIFRLDFSRRTVEKIDSQVPPRGVREASAHEQDVPSSRSGYVLAALGTPPSDQDNED